MFITISTFSKSFSLSLRPIQIQSQDFCRFPSNVFKDFCLHTQVRPFYASIFNCFHFLCILGRYSNLWKFGVFVVFNHFFQNLSVGFCCWMIVNWSLWFNLINLMNREKLDFLGLETTQMGFLFSWALIDEIGLFDWLIWSLYSII